MACSVQAYSRRAIFSFMCLLVIKTYDSILLFSRKFQFQLIGLITTSSIFVCGLLYQYSYFIQKNFPLTKTEKIKEQVFLGKNVFKKDPLTTLYGLLKEPSICKDDINSLVRLYRKMDLPSDKNLFKKDRAYENLILNKTACGIFTSLKLIPELDSLEVEKKLAFFKKGGRRDATRIFIKRHWRIKENSP